MLIQKHTIKEKKSSSVNHCSKFIFNNVILTITIDRFCRLSDYLWFVDIKFWMMETILVEFIESCNVRSGQLSDRVPPYACITLQAAIRIAIRAKRRIYGRQVVDSSRYGEWCCSCD